MQTGSAVVLILICCCLHGCGNSDKHGAGTSPNSRSIPSEATTSPDLHARQTEAAVQRDAYKRLRLAEATMRQREVTEAINAYEYILTLDPEQDEAVSQLIDLYAMTGQRVKAEQLLLRQAESQGLGFEKLVLLTDFDRRHPRYASLLEECEQSNPSDSMVHLGLAFEDSANKDLKSARHRLEPIIADHPSLTSIAHNPGPQCGGVSGVVISRPAVGGCGG